MNKIEKLTSLVERIEALEGKQDIEDTHKEAAQIDHEVIGFVDELEASGFETASAAADDLRNLWNGSKYYGYCLNGYE